MSLPDAKPHTISIRRSRFNRGEFGEDVQVPVTFASGIGCWIQPSPAQEILEFYRRDIKVTHTIFLDPADQQRFRPGDRIVVTGGPSLVGDVLLYQGGDDQSAGLGVISKVMAELERVT